MSIVRRGAIACSGGNGVPDARREAPDFIQATVLAMGEIGKIKLLGRVAFGMGKQS
jgi:hypothetical protein